MLAKQIVGAVSVLGVIVFVVYYLISPSPETVRQTTALCTEMQTINMKNVKTSADAKALEVWLKNVIAKYPNADSQLSLITNELRKFVIDMARLIEKSESYKSDSWWFYGKALATGAGVGLGTGAVSGPGAVFTAIAGGIFSLKKIIDEDSQARNALETQLSKFQVDIDVLSRKSKDVFQHLKDKYAVNCSF